MIILALFGRMRQHMKTPWVLTYFVTPISQVNLRVPFFFITNQTNIPHSSEQKKPGVGDISSTSVANGHKLSENGHLPI